MATTTLLKRWTAGEEVYFALRNAAGQYFDFDAAQRIFRNLADCDDPYLLATEQPLAVGADESNYVAALNLSHLAPGLAIVECTSTAFLVVGGDPDLTADTPISQPVDVTAQLGKLGVRTLQALFSANLRSTEGVAFHCRVKLLADGATVPLHTIDDEATCEVSITMHGNFPQFTLDDVAMGAVNAAHEFVGEETDPEFETDEGYGGEVTITAGGVTVSCPINFVIAATA